MIYVKAKTDEAEIKVVITDENVYTLCPICGKEHMVDIIGLCEDGNFDLYGTSVYCPECSEEHRKEYIENDKHTTNCGFGDSNPAVLCKY